MDGLVGYGSDEEGSQPMEEEEREGGLVTILGAEDHEASEGSGQGVDLSHLTAPAARGGEDTAAMVPRPAGSAAAGLTPEEAQAEPGAGEQQQQQQGGQPPEAGQALAGNGAAAEAAAAASGAEAGRLLPEELRQPPEGQCDPAVQARVANWLHLQRTRGRFINEELRKSRGYRNPEFFQKMIEHLEIDQYGTCLPPEVFDPRNLPREDYLDSLQKQWQEEADRRQKERSAAGRIEFTKSASQPNLAGAAAAAGGLQPGTLPGATVAAAQAAAAAAAAMAAGQQGPSMAHNPLMPGVGVGGPVTAAQLAQAQQYQSYVLQMQQMQQQRHPPPQPPGSAAAVALAAAQARAAQLAAQARGASR